MAPNLSKSQLLNYLQCPRRFWLEQYHPEHEGDVAPMDAALDAEEAAKATAHAVLTGDNIVSVPGRLGLRNAIEQTGALLEPGVIVLDATFEFEGISTHVDVLDWSGESRRAISATAATEIAPHHIEACAIQAWVMRGLELPEHRYVVGLTSVQRSADDSLASRFELTDITEHVLKEVGRIAETVTQARDLHASLHEPAAQTGSHCHKPGYACPFLEHCEAG